MKNEHGTVDALFIPDDTLAGEETGKLVEAFGDRIDEHGYFGGLGDMLFRRANTHMKVETDTRGRHLVL